MALVVLTGGARSGKSRAAQHLAQARAASGVDVVVAVFGRSSDAEMEARIQRHRSERPEGFDTLEVVDATTWLEAVPEESLLVVDCLGTLLGLVMETAWEDGGVSVLGDAEPEALAEGLEERIAHDFERLVDALACRKQDTIVVTNEVGLGLVPAWASGRLFRDLLGRANQQLVSAADAAHLCICGRMIDLAEAPTDISWPVD